MAKGFLPYNIDQRLLLPPDMRAWLPEGHLALFVLDVVAALDLRAIHAVYEAKDDRGRAGFDPTRMVALLRASSDRTARHRGHRRSLLFPSCEARFAEGDAGGALRDEGAEGAAGPRENVPSSLRSAQAAAMRAEGFARRTPRAPIKTIPQRYRSLP